jgi:hypothetical protein
VAVASSEAPTMPSWRKTGRCEGSRQSACTQLRRERGDVGGEGGGGEGDGGEGGKTAGRLSESGEYVRTHAHAHTRTHTQARTQSQAAARSARSRRTARSVRARWP